MCSLEVGLSYYYSFHPANAAATAGPSTRFSEFFEVIVHTLAQLQRCFPHGLLLGVLCPLLGLVERLLCPLALLALLVQFFAQVFAFLAFPVEPLAQTADDLKTLSILELVLGELLC